MAIGRTEDRDTPWNPTVLRHRVHVPRPDPRNPSGPAVKPTAHTGRTHDRNRPDPSQLPNPCNPGAVHTWIPGCLALLGSRNDGCASASRLSPGLRCITIP